MGVASTSVSAICTIIYFIFNEKKMDTEQFSGTSIYTDKEIFKELVKVAIPYLLSSLMFSSSGMFVLLVFSSGLEAYGTEGKLITIYQGIINYQASKISSIPMIIMSGFCLVIIPHITEAVTNRDDKKVTQLIHKTLETVNYLSVPLVCFMIFFSQEIYYIMYGTYYLEIGTDLLAKSLACQLLMNLAGILNSLLIALQLRKKYLTIEALRLTYLVLVLKPFLVKFGVNGYFFALASEYLLMAVGSIILINSNYDLYFKGLFDNFSKSWLGCIPMFVIVAILRNITSLNCLDHSRFLILIFTGIMFVICIGIYVFITYKLKIVETLFDVNSIKDGFNRILKRKDAR